MKTAEDWLKERLAGKHGEPKTAQEWDTLSIALFREIQTDAVKHGMTLAAELCGSSLGYPQTAEECQHEITTIRDNFALP